MSNFSAVLDRLDQKIMAVFCDSAILRPKSGIADLLVDIKFRQPTQVDQLQSAFIVRSRPTVKVSVLQVPSLVKGDIFILNGQGWRVAEAPSRPDSGRWWFSEVEPLGSLA